MADNVAITAGTDAPLASIATDQVGSDHYQLIKLAFGALDTATLVTGSAGLPVNVLNASLAITAASLPLPAGAATSASQDTGNTALATIAAKDFATQTTLVALSAKIPTLGQALAAASLPVVLTAAQIASLTPPTAITGFATETTLAAASAKLPATLGQKAMAASLAVVLASDQSTVPVSLASIPSHAVTNAGTFATQAAQSGTWNVATVTTVTTVSAVTAITNALPAGSNTIGNVVPVTATSGGWTPGKLISAASTNATSVKASAGQLGGVLATNSNAAVRYLKLYNKASAPTVGTDTPVTVIAIPPSNSGVFLKLSPGIDFGTGIAFALTTGSADNDTGAVAASEVIVNYFTK